MARGEHANNIGITLAEACRRGVNDHLIERGRLMESRAPRPRGEARYHV